MIGDLLSNLATAQKLSIGQIQQAVQDGTLPAYVGVPLLQQKMQERNEAAQILAGKQQQGQPPIAQQVLQAASQLTQPQQQPMAAPQGIQQVMAQPQEEQPEQGIDTAQSNLPTQMAGGGIVAFASGGSNELIGDDDMSADDDEAPAGKEDQALFSRLLAGLSVGEQGFSAPYDPQQVQPQAQPQSQGIEVIGRKLNMHGHPYHDEVVKYSKKIGLDPNIGLKVLYTETGGLKDPAHAKSKAGAYGPMQLMAPTAKELRINRKDPIQNVHGGLDYIKQQLDTFGNPKLAAAAYNAGPGAVKHALNSGMGISALPMETRQYAANFKTGGVVALAGGGVPKSNVGNLFLQGLGLGDSSGTSFPEYLGEGPIDPELLQQQVQTQNKPATPAKPAAPAVATSVEDITKSPMTGDQFKIQPSVTKTEEKTIKETPDEDLTDIRAMIKNSMEEAKKQKEIGGWLSLLSASTGALQAAGDIRPGKVHTALGDLATGAQQGIGTYAQTAKQYADQQKGILAAQLGLSRASLYEKLRRDALAQQAASTKFNQGIAQQRLNVLDQANRIKLGGLQIKANTEWENSQDKADLIKDLKKRNSNWQQDSKLLGEYNLRKNRFTNQFIGNEQAENVQDASDLLNQQG